MIRVTTGDRTSFANIFGPEPEVLEPKIPESEVSEPEVEKFIQAGLRLGIELVVKKDKDGEKYLAYARICSENKNKHMEPIDINKEDLTESTILRYCGSEAKIPEEILGEINRINAEQPSNLSVKIEDGKYVIKDDSNKTMQTYKFDTLEELQIGLESLDLFVSEDLIKDPDNDPENSDSEKSAVEESDSSSSGKYTIAENSENANQINTEQSSDLSVKIEDGKDVVKNDFNKIINTYSTLDQLHESLRDIDLFSSSSKMKSFTIRDSRSIRKTFKNLFLYIFSSILSSFSKSRSSKKIRNCSVSNSDDSIIPDHISPTEKEDEPSDKHADFQKFRLFIDERSQDENLLNVELFSTYLNHLRKLKNTEYNDLYEACASKEIDGSIMKDDILYIIEKLKELKPHLFESNSINNS